MSRLPGRRRWLPALALLAACTPLSVPTATRPVPPVGSAPAPAQTLYRVRYEGPAGQGSLRLVLRQVAADRFQLQAADTFGRAAWSLDLDRGEARLVNHRERFTCVAGSELRIPELALRPLPLEAVPRVLAGEVPVPPPSAVEDPSDWTDRSGRRWTLRREEGELRSWTMWVDGEPRLYWLAQPRGGVLSHRDGSQFRWRQVTREGLAPAEYRRLEPPAGYPEEPCEALAGAEGAAGDV